MNAITRLKASRVQIVFPKPWIVAACSVFAMNIINMSCNCRGNVYQLHMQSLWLNTLNWWVTISPAAQNRKINANDQNATIPLAQSSNPKICSDFETKTDYKINKLNQTFHLNHITNCIWKANSELEMPRRAHRK